MELKRIPYGLTVCKVEDIYAVDNIIKHRGDLTKIIIEEYYKAQEYRVFVTKRGDYAVLLRDPAHIYGDGINTIEYLIKKQ